MRSLLRVVCLVALLPTTIEAHQFWIRPGRFEIERGAHVRARLFVGDGFEKGEAFPRTSAHLEWFRVWTPSGVHAVRGLEGRDPAGMIRFTERGPAWIGYQSHPTRVELTSEKFDAYLREEGLERALRDRIVAGASDAPVIETFRRCAKSRVEVTPPNARRASQSTKPKVDAATKASANSPLSRTLGLDLELVLESTPRAGDEKAPAVVRLLLFGKPLAGAKIRGFLEGTPEVRVDARTDAAGRATVVLPRGGIWMLASVHIARSKEEGVDWESLWSSLTLSLSAPPAAPEVTSGKADRRR